MFLSKIFDSNDKQIKNLQKTVSKIDELKTNIQSLSDEEIKSRFLEIKSIISEQSSKLDPIYKQSIKAIKDKSLKVKNEQGIEKLLEQYTPEVFAIIRETAKRAFDREHYRVQLLGGLALSTGKIAELKTGEGKTQVAWLPLGLHALTGRGVHLVTVNDYLARTHGEYAGILFSALGLTVGIVEPRGCFKVEYTTVDKKIVNPGDCSGKYLKAVTKKEAYSCDIVYATNSEIGFDYLRDNMVDSVQDQSLPELYFVIVDEVDSILIDEARTPLIISQPNRNPDKMYTDFANLAALLENGKHYVSDEKTKSVNLTDQGYHFVEEKLNIKNIYENFQVIHHLDNALKAKELYRKDKEYLVKNGEILIVDDFTGRILPGRRFGEGMHQAIEAKERVEVKQESRTVATITYQNLFRLYKKLSGMTGTAQTEAEEFAKIYNLEVISIPTNKQVIRQDLIDAIYKNRTAKYNAVVKEIITAHAKHQPVLIGTASVSHSEELSTLLKKAGVKHEVLNAKNFEREAHIIANAGQLDAVTISTNMAGRGTDIKLGKGVAEVGGLYVIGTERHESRRIDNQLRGRSGRQGDNGKSKFFIALDDELMRIHGGNIIQNFLTMANFDETIPIENGLIAKQIEKAQQRVESNNFDTRKNIVEFDDVVTFQREIYYTRRQNLLMIKAKLESMPNDDMTVKMVQEELMSKLAQNSFYTSLLGEKVQEKIVKVGEKNFWLIYIKICLTVMNELWMDHLDVMVELKNGIFLRANAQKDPLTEYKIEGFDYFEKFISEVDQKIAGILIAD